MTPENGFPQLSVKSRIKVHFIINHSRKRNNPLITAFAGSRGSLFAQSENIIGIDLIESAKCDEVADRQFVDALLVAGVDLLCRAEQRGDVTLC